MATLNMYWYGYGLDAIHRGDVDFLADTIKCALLTASYTPNQGTHRYFSDVSASQASGSGYTAGGATLASKTMTYDSTNRRVTLDAANVVWDPSTLTAQYAVLYKDTGSGSTSQLIGYGVAATAQSSDGAAFTVTWNANGILRTTAATP